ncbi:MAG: hypothetical protein CVU38_07990 [Chloroflexi bacterium HGW-Chloroflexi-1]|nr:MAG: hypothetical protein CVU38_07990 [Chloroflexi bacterium HGW-Chloroflexi-1]
MESWYALYTKPNAEAQVARTLMVRGFKTFLLRKIEAQGGLPTHHFKPGDEVIIEEGPLAGLSGIFQGPLGPAERVRILVDFLGQASRIEVPVAALRAATEEESRRRRRGTRGHGRRIRYRDALPADH